MVSNWKVIQHLWNNDRLSHPLKTLAIVIALHRNEKTLLCNPTQFLLARRMDTSQAKISRMVTRLRKLDVIVTIQQVNPNEHFKKRLQYYFLFDLEGAEMLVDSEGFAGNKDDFRCIMIKLGKSDIITGTCISNIHSP